MDISQDYLLFDNPETVSLTRTRAGDSTTIDNITATNAPAKSLQQAFGGIQLEANERGFSLPVAQAGADRLIRGDVITDSSDTDWVIQVAAKQTLGTRWLVVARQKAV